MQIVCDEEAREDALNNGINLVEFLDLLSREPSPWEMCEVASSWGMLLFAFFSPLEKAMVPVTMDVFLLTHGEVVSDAGVYTSRWKRLAEEVVRWSDGHRVPRNVLVLH